MASKEGDADSATSESLSAFLTTFLCKESIAYCVLVVCYLASYTLERKHWLLLDFVSSVLVGLTSLVFPQHLISFETAIEINGLHLTSVRAIASLILGSCVVVWLTRDSRDNTVHTSLLWSRVLVMTLVIASLFYQLTPSMAKDAQLHMPFVKFILVWTALWALGSFIQSVRSPDWGGYQESFSPMNRHLRFDFIFALAAGGAGFIFPKAIVASQTTVSVDGYETFLTRLLGLYLIGTALVAGRAVNFLSDQDKSSIFLGRLFQITIQVCIITYAHYAFAVFISWHIYVGLFLCVVWGGNSILGYRANLTKAKDF